MDPETVVKSALVRKRESVFLRLLRGAKVACLGTRQRSVDAFSLDVASPRAVQEQVQAGLLGPLLYLDSRAAFGRKGHIGLVHKLGNKTFSYKLPIQPHRAPNKLHQLGLPGSEYEVDISSSQFKLCKKVLASLIPQLIKLQQDALAHQNYLEPANTDQLATFMSPNDMLLAATDQLTELGSVSVPHVIMTIDDALVILSRPQALARWFHRNAVHPDKAQPLVTSTSADTMHLQAADIVNMVNMCSGPEGCSVAQLLHCIRKGGLQEVIKTACMQDESGTGLPPKLREAIVIMLSAAPQDSELVRDVLIALQHGLEVACNASLLPELILRLLQLPNVCQAGRLFGLSHSLVKYLQRHQTQPAGTPTPTKDEVAQPTTAPPQKWYSKLMQHSSRHKYQPDATVDDALVSTPAFRQALYIQQLAQAPISRTASVELAARVLSKSTGRPQSGRPTVQSALQEEKAHRQQATCTAIKSLLHLSPLLAEEEPLGQAAADVLINYCLLPGDDVVPRSSKDLDEEERELRQLCLLALVALSPQPQSVASLFTLSPQLHGGSTAAVHDSQLSSTSGHALLSWGNNVVLTDWQLKKGSLAPQHTETYLQLMTDYVKLVPHPMLVAGGDTSTGLILQEVLFPLGPAMYWSHRRTLLVTRTIELQTAWLDKVCLTGPARQAIQTFLTHESGEIYKGFAEQQLTASVSQCDAAQVLLECCTAYLRLIAALPSDQAPTDMRVQRSSKWPCSHPSLLPTCTDIVTPPTDSAAATHALPPAAAAGNSRAKQAEPDTEAVSAALPVRHATLVTSLTRTQAVQALDLLVTPPDGLVWGVLSNSSKPAGEHKAALEMVTAVYQCNSSSVTEDAEHAAFCAKVHVTGFMCAYAEGDAPEGCQHLKALQALVKHKIPAVRQQLVELNLMSFLIQQVSLEAELQMNVSMPVSSTPTTAPPSSSGLRSVTAQPSSCPARTSGLLHTSQPDAVPGVQKVPAGSLERQSQGASYRRSNSKLRLPALPPGSARSPRVSVRGLGAPGGATNAIEPSGSVPSPRISARYSGRTATAKAADGLKLPAGFVSTGDLEEDTRRLLEMESESEESDSSSVQSSPPTSARVAPKGFPMRPPMPPLNLASSARKGGPAALPTPLSMPPRTGGSVATPASPMTPHIPSLPSLQIGSGKAASPYMLSNRLPKLVLPGSGGHASLRSDAFAQVTTPAAGDGHRQGQAKEIASEHKKSSRHDVLSYEERRLTRLIYPHPDLHLQVVQLILELLLTANGELDPHYSSTLDPAAQQPLSILQRHLGWEANAGLAGPLLQWAKAWGPPAVRLLRLTCRFLFDSSMYQDKQRIARGAYAHVFTCQAPSFCRDAPDLAVKVTDLPSAGDDSISQVTAFREVAIMQRLRHTPGICRLHDFGICSDSIMLVMTKYRCSLREWRHRQPDNCRNQLRLYLNIFAQLASLLQAVSQAGLVHFDLKCDNVFVQPLPGVSEEDFWSPVDDAPPFEVVLGDFGDSHDFSQAGCHPISLNRGTECMRSPEMLLAASSPAAQQNAGPGHAASDVWALGCLLYELVMGTVLFPNELDWPKFFITVTDPTQKLLPAAAVEAMEQIPAVMDLLSFILVRDQAQRPSAGDIQVRVQHILHSPHSTLPAHHRPVVLPLSPLKSAAASGPFLTPTSPSSPAQHPSTAAFYSSHLAAVSERLCLGHVSAMQDAMLLRQANITHAVIVCSHAQLRHAASPEELSVAEVLTWLLADAQLAQTVRSCAAAGVQAKLVLVDQPDKAGGTQAKTMLQQQLPTMLQYIADTLRHASSKVLIAGCNELEGDAAVVAIAYSAQHTGQGLFHALVELQHCYHILQLEDRHKQLLAHWSVQD